VTNHQSLTNLKFTIPMLLLTSDIWSIAFSLSHIFTSVDWIQSTRVYFHLCDLSTTQRRYLYQLFMVLCNTWVTLLPVSLVNSGSSGNYSLEPLGSFWVVVMFGSLGFE